MYKTLRLSFALKNTYRVNSILYSLKQIPLIKRLLPDTLYKIRGLKILANLLSIVWEVITVFLGKFLYFITLVCGVGVLYEHLPDRQVYLHILLFLTVIGAFMNTGLFNPTRDKYYAMILMRMNAREYTLVNYGYSIIKVIVGFLPFSIIFGTLRDIPLWFCLIFPFTVAGMKMTYAAYSLWDYEKSGNIYNEKQNPKISLAGNRCSPGTCLRTARCGYPTAEYCVDDCTDGFYPNRRLCRPENYPLSVLS